MQPHNEFEAAGGREDEDDAEDTALEKDDDEEDDKGLDPDVLEMLKIRDVERSILRDKHKKKKEKKAMTAKRKEKVLVRSSN